VSYRIVKRLFDLVAAVTMLIVLAPVMLAIAIGVRVGMGSPVLFRQRRLGRNNCTFYVVKFRSMREAVDANGRPLPDEKRTTRLGRFLRKSSLDELPQLFNVLKGEMSLVGPRPLLPEYLEVYTPRERTRQNVLPGITGLAQVNGRNQAKWDDRLEFDAQYVERQSFWLDARILALTVWKVLARKDVDFPNAENYPLTYYRKHVNGAAS
jgi:lipopolysaccharide/colanic/teichoic acid biosynthesis glycosyltransferase